LRGGQSQQNKKPFHKGETAFFILSLGSLDAGHTKIFQPVKE
jgi:hypothetical protein